VNQTQKQHVVAIGLLQKLGLDNIKLEQQRDGHYTGHYTYRAWNTPLLSITVHRRLFGMAKFAFGRDVNIKARPTHHEPTTFRRHDRTAVRASGRGLLRNYHLPSQLD
jgi:hypothetical protein